MSRIAERHYGDSPAPYPASAGWKERDGTTSRSAARAADRTSAARREAVLREIAAAPDGLTADEVAARLDCSVLSIRPRVSELGKQSPPAIVKSGRTRRNASGQSAAVWILNGANR